MDTQCTSASMEFHPSGRRSESGRPASGRAGPDSGDFAHYGSVRRLSMRAAALGASLLTTLMILPADALAVGGMHPSNLVEWSSGESEERLSRSAHKRDFFPLSNHFISQDNSIFCGPVSASIVLNALRLGREGLPQDSSSIAEHELAWLPEGANPFFGKYTPNNVLTGRTKSRIEVLGKPIEIGGKPMRDFGLQLHQLAQVLRSHGVDVTVRVVGEAADASTIRREIARNLASGNDYVLINYARRELGQQGGGHISPVGAYDEESDSFLIMDVNPNRAPWAWVRTGDLVKAMRTFDTIENRGYLLIAETD